MKRQAFYPRPQGDQAEWHTNFATKLPGYATALGLTQGEEDAAVADNLILAYALGDWIVSARESPTAWTAALDDLTYGTGSTNFAFPTLQVPPAPALPGSLTGVKPGALQRTLDLAQVLKHRSGYTETIGLDLGIVGEEDSAEHAHPEFSLKSEGADGCHCVKVRYKKYGHEAVVVYSKRGTGDFELLGRPSSNPFRDERPLLVAGQPEIRHYKLRFYDDDEETGEWTDVASITVSP